MFSPESSRQIAIGAAEEKAAPAARTAWSGYLVVCTLCAGQLTMSRILLRRQVADPDKRSDRVHARRPHVLLTVGCELLTHCE